MDTSLDLKSQKPVAPFPRQRPRRGLRLLLRLIAFAALLILLAPTMLSWGGLRSIVESELSKRLRGNASIEDASYGWLSGLRLDGLRIENPPGFPSTSPAMLMQSMVADVSIGSLLFGTVSARGEVTGLQVNVDQRDDGSTNLQQLAVANDSQQLSDADVSQTTTKKITAPDQAGAASSRLNLDLRLRECSVTIRRQGEVLEALTDFQCDARSASGSNEIDVEASGKLRAGDLSVLIKLDPRAESAAAKLNAHGLDLAAWSPLLDVLMPGQVTTLAGRVDGELSAQMHKGDQLELAGELVVDDPRLAGPAVQGMDIRGRQWRLRPALTLGSNASSEIDASEFGVDLEWLRVDGMQPTQDERVSVNYTVDVAALANFGGPIPELLKSSGATLTGRMEVPATDLPTDMAGWAQVTAATAALKIKALDLSGFTLRDLGMDLDVKDGEVHVTTTPDAKLDGGALSLKLDVDLTDFAALPAKAALQWQGGELTGGATQSLRYLVPMFAGMNSEVADIHGGVNVDLRFTGPIKKSPDQTWLSWLDGWSGDGAIGLTDTAFAPSPSLKGLLEPLGALSAKLAPIAKGGKLRIDALSAPFVLDEGKITATGAKWLAAGKEFGLSGSVALDGTIDYAVDFASLLRERSDGAKVLKALGGTLPGAKLTGTVDAPKLGLPELGDLAARAIKAQGKDLLKDGIQKGLESLFGGRKKRKLD